MNRNILVLFAVVGIIVIVSAIAYEPVLNYVSEHVSADVCESNAETLQGSAFVDSFSDSLSERLADVLVTPDYQWDRSKVLDQASIVAFVDEIKGGAVIQNLSHTVIPIGSFINRTVPVEDYDPSITPVNWPSHLPWNPSRYFEPSYTGSELYENQIVIRSTNDMVWCYNDFFNDENSQYYSPFYRHNLPTTQSPQVFPQPGFTKHTGPSDQIDIGILVFSLQRIDFSQLFGGSIELIFNNIDETGTEIIKNTIVWDVKDLSMHIFVTPDKRDLNNPNNSVYYGEINCEFVYPSCVAYDVSQTKPIMLEDNLCSQLNEALFDLGSAVEYRLSTDALRFSYGYLRNRYPDRLLPNKVVDGIIISDQDIGFYTSEGIPMVSISVQLRDVNLVGAPGNTLFGIDIKQLYIMVLDSESYWVGDEAPIRADGPRYAIPVREGSDTPWIRIGKWSLWEIYYLQKICLGVTGSWDGEYETEYGYELAKPVCHRYLTEWQIDEGALENAWETEDYGVVQLITFNWDSQDNFWQNMKQEPYFEFKYAIRISLYKR